MAAGLRVVPLLLDDLGWITSQLELSSENDEPGASAKKSG